MTNHSPDSLMPQISVAESLGDPQLIHWLSNLKLEQSVIDRIVLEEYTLDDLLNHVSKSDLKRFNLKGIENFHFLFLTALIARVTRFNRNLIFKRWNRIENLEIDFGI